jgi:hypothetical protein
VLQQGYATSPPESFPTVGTYAITATYSGNSTYASSTTATSLKLIVTPAPAATTATTLALASRSITVGGSDALAVTVNSNTATGPVPTGYVQLSAGGTTFGALLPLSQGTVTTSSAVTSLSIGTTQITAAYLGDSNYLGSTSAPQTLTVSADQQTPVVVLTPQFTTIAAGASATLTANVNGSGTNTPTGTVQFFDGATSLAIVPVVNGTATTASLAFNTVGTFQLTAVFSGDANYISATSAAVSITVTTGAPYQLIAAPATISLTAGSTADNGINIDIQQTSAFVGNITLACTVAYNGTGTPNDMPTCALQGNDFPIPGGPASSLLTIATVAQQATSAAFRAGPPFTRWGGITVSSLLLCLIAPRRLRQTKYPIRICALLALFVMVSGCGGSATGTTSSTAPISTPAPVASGTTAGSYTVTVTSTNTAGVPEPAPLAIQLTVN